MVKPTAGRYQPGSAAWVKGEIDVSPMAVVPEPRWLIPIMTDDETRRLLAVVAR